jgi:hypothetical protein
MRVTGHGLFLPCCQTFFQAKTYNRVDVSSKGFHPQRGPTALPANMSSEDHISTAHNRGSKWVPIIFRVLDPARHLRGLPRLQ